MSSSSSSSASSDEKHSKRKKDKSKKDKKSKKNKKVKKDDKKRKKMDKEKKRAEAAEDWWCERLESVRLIRQMLQIESAIAEELEGLFTALDEGEVVHLDGLANKQVKKKLRHLLQCMKLTAVDSTGFKSADRKVSFSALFTSLHKRALAGVGGNNAASGQECAFIAVESAAPAAAAAAAAAEEVGGAVDSGGVLREEEAASEAAAELQAEKPRPKKVGPQLPMPGVGAVDADEESSEDDQGPKMEGAERAGVDLDLLQTTRRREKWMTEAHESMAGLFDDSVDCRTAKAGRFEVRRSKAEEEAFEKAMRDRGPSLMSQTKEGKFEGQHEEEVERLRKKQRGEQDLWGASAKEQERARPAAGAAAASGIRRPFDPEQDLQVRKPISGEAFTKFVETSGSELAGRFSRGAVATSFL